MKRIKIGFLAAVALISFSFTAATKVDFFKPQNKVVPTCVEGDFEAIVFTTATGTGSQVTHNYPIDGCTATRTYCATVNVPASDVLGEFEEITCDQSVEDIFCCAKITGECEEGDDEQEVTIFCKKRPV